MGEAESQPPSVEADDDPLLHRVLNDRFTILAPIGVGGMGKVYRAIQSPLDRVVALKVLNPSYANGQDPGFRQRFFLEASLTSKLRHRNTITVIDYGQTPDGIFYIAMEYLEGQPLSQILAKSGPLHWTRCLQIAQQICRSLREAHKLGIIHRDLKPANVMLLTEDREDIVKVLDFGLVKSFIREGNTPNTEVTNAGMFLGSPQYMAPEQARNHADPRSDIYSLGIVLYQMLVGRPPFAAKDTIDIIFKHMNERPTPMRSVRKGIDLPKEVEALVMKCLEKQPSWRFQSMDDVLEAMRKAATASGMDGILTEAGANGAGQTPAPMHTPVLGINGADKDGMFSIEISVVKPVENLLSFLRRRKLLKGAIVAISLLLALGGTATVLSLRGGSRNDRAPGGVEKAKAKETAAAPAKQKEPAPAAEVRAPKQVKFRISTEPEGAQVSMGRRSLGSTPLAFDLQAGPDGTATAELLVTLKGYHPMTVITGGSGPEIVLSQRLQARSSQKPTAIVVDRREDTAKPAPVVSEKPEEKNVGGSQPTPRSPAEERLPGTTAPPATTSPPAPAPTPVVAPPTAPPAPPSTNPIVAPVTLPSSSKASVVAQVALPSSSKAPVVALATGVPASSKAPLELDESKVKLTKLSGPDPEYTQKAIEHEVEGVMSVKCVVTAEGAVHNCRVLKSLPFMSRAVVTALERRRYKPYLVNGKPTEIDFTFNIKLSLPQ